MRRSARRVLRVRRIPTDARTLARITELVAETVVRVTARKRVATVRWRLEKRKSPELPVRAVATSRKPAL